jgi:hypothetical protein
VAKEFMRPNENATGQKIEKEILTPYAPAVLSKDRNGKCYATDSKTYFGAIE